MKIMPKLEKRERSKVNSKKSSIMNNSRYVEWGWMDGDVVECTGCSES